MRTPLLSMGLLVAVAGGSVFAESRQFVFEPGHTRVLFSVSHVGFTLMPGRFHGISGGFAFDEEDFSSGSVEVVIDAASVDMDHEGLNEHLRGPDFFDTVRFPEIRYQSGRVEMTGQNTARVYGDLTLLGQTRPVVLEATFNKAGIHPTTMKFIAGFSATATLDRTAFGMTYGAPEIGADIHLRVEVEGEPE